MKLASSRTALLLAVLLAACEQSAEKTANVVQAATRAAAETGQQLSRKVAELAQMTPEEARAKAQEVLDLAARELQEVKDSETARKIAQELEPLVQKLGELKRTIGPKLNLASLQQALVDLIERFKNDPRVVSALKALHEKLHALTGE